MDFWQRLITKLRQGEFAVAETPPRNIDCYAWVAIHPASRSGRVGDPPSRYTVARIELNKQLWQQYWDDNIDIGGYKETAKEYEFRVIDAVNEQELMVVILKWVDNFERFFIPLRAKYPY